MIGKSINKIVFYISKGVGFIIGYTYRRLFGPFSKNDKGDISKNEEFIVTCQIEEKKLDSIFCFFKVAYLVILIHKPLKNKYLERKKTKFCKNKNKKHLSTSRVSSYISPKIQPRSAAVVYSFLHF